MRGTAHAKPLPLSAAGRRGPSELERGGIRRQTIRPHTAELLTFLMHGRGASVGVLTSTAPDPPALRLPQTQPKGDDRTRRLLRGRIFGSFGPSLEPTTTWRSGNIGTETNQDQTGFRKERLLDQRLEAIIVIIHKQEHMRVAHESGAQSVPDG